MIEQQEKPKSLTECFLAPCGERVIVLEDPFKESSKLIITPENAKRRGTTGRIIRASIPAIDRGFREGQRVLYTQFAGTSVTFKNKLSYRIVACDEIIAFVNSDDDTLELTAS